MTGVAVLMVWCFLAVPTLCWLVTRNSMRHYGRLEAAKLDAKKRDLRELQLELGRQAHDMDTMIKATVNSVADDTTIHDPEDWGEL